MPKKGERMTPEQRAKIAAAKRGKPKSPEHRAKIAAAMLGNRNTAGHRMTPAQLANIKRARPRPRG